VISLSFSSKEAEWSPFLLPLLIGNFPRETPLLAGFIFGLKIGSSATMLSECVAQELLGRANST